MGLLLGRPHVDELRTLLVTDVFPLPVEGAETRVLADDQEVMNYMISLGDSLERTRPSEMFMGWYHSHPFDVEVHSHCFMSATDITTQLAWQRAEDRNGNPWLGIVVDPLRSLAKGKPELGAFRAYPPEYVPPANEMPDGRINADADARVERWGNCWNRYHEIEVTTFMSSLSERIMQMMSKKYLWISRLSTTPTMDKEYCDRFPERINGIVSKLSSYSKGSRLMERSMKSALGYHSTLRNPSGGDGPIVSEESCRYGQRDYMSGDGSISGGKGAADDEGSKIARAAQSSAEIASEQCVSSITQTAKAVLFSGQLS